MISVVLIVDKRYSCQWMAGLIVDKLKNLQINCYIRNFNTKIVATDIIFLIFPILSDNRIPDEVENWLVNSKFLNLKKVFLCISGDFSENLVEGEMVLNEIIKLLDKKHLKLSFNPFMLDTPIFPNPSIPISTWIEKAIQICVEKTNSFFFTISKSKLDEQTLKINAKIKETSQHCVLKSAEWLSLCKLLPEPPIISVSESGIKLEFITNSTYPRSLLLNLSVKQLKDVWRIINNIPEITGLGLAFARLHDWPFEITNNLLSLDIRDNCFRSFDFLENFPSICHLNISANYLTQIPSNVFKLLRIKELFCYKNQIEFINQDIILLANLERLSLYRNQLKNFPEALLSCTSINYLNIGANRILELPQEITKLRNLETLILRNSPISTLPQSLNIKKLDLDKTPIKYLCYVN